MSSLEEELHNNKMPSSSNKKKRRRTHISSSTSLVYVEAKPTIKDPRELVTILTYSLRSLFGELEYHSCQLQVQAVRKENVVPLEEDDRGGSGNSHDDSEENNVAAEETSKMMVMAVTCPSESVAAVRAALTMVTPPPYLSDSVYRFDILKVEKKRRIRK